VRLRVHALADRSGFQDALEEAVRGQNVRGDQISRLAALDPVDVATAARTSVDAVVELGVSATTANKLVELAPSVLRELEQVDVPDRVELQINLGTPTNEDWLAIDRLSPGQRATALLALALAAGDEPLVIDQPEDDLDNRYIFAEVVQVLARVCEHRQVIVATHNANIPILGDAEMLVALDAVADRSTVLAAGGLEDPGVAGCARQILEGGDEAFRARQRRYLAARHSA
jgi:ABC-type histidine transport system ATPase subunit